MFVWPMELSNFKKVWWGTLTQAGTAGHCPKVEDRVETFFSHFLDPYFLKKKFEELWTATNPKLLELLPSFECREWGLSISYQPTYIFIKLVAVNCQKTSPTPGVTQFRFCVALVSHCQPLSKWLWPWYYKTQKKKTFFGHFRKYQEFKYLKSTTGRYCTKIYFIFIGKHCFYNIFLYNLKSYWNSVVLSFAIHQ